MKRIVPLVVLALALAVPAVAFADGNPAPTLAAGAQQAGHHGSRAARLRAVRRHVRMELRACRKAPTADKQACLQKILGQLDTLKSKIDAVEAKVQQACPGATPATDGSTSQPTTGDRCSRAPRVLARLERMKARIDKLEARITQYLSGDTSTSSPSSGDQSSSDADSIASLESQLAAVQAQQG